MVKCGQVTVSTMYFVYVLKSLRDKQYYYGQTQDIERRLDNHNKGLVKSTKSRRPFILVYFEIVVTRKEALKKERFFKSGIGRMYLKTKIKASSYNG